MLATGVVDELPPFEGFASFYGRSAFHCPYCDGWEMRDQPLAVYGPGERGVNMALQLTGWSTDLVLCTNGEEGLSEENRGRLTCHGIAIRAEPVVRLEGRDGVLERIVFAAGPPLARRALFVNTRWRQRSDLPGKLGCEFGDKGAVQTGKHEATCVAGLFCAGDASVEGGLAIVAAAEGALAGMAINQALLKEDLARKESTSLHH